MEERVLYKLAMVISIAAFGNSSVNERCGLANIVNIQHLKQVLDAWKWPEPILVTQIASTSLQPSSTFTSHVVYKADRLLDRNPRSLEVNEPS